MRGTLRSGRETKLTSHCESGDSQVCCFKEHNLIIHKRVESLSCYFPRELVSSVHPRELLCCDP